MVGLDHRLFDAVRKVADHTVWAHSLVVGYATYGIVLFALVMIAAWWRSRSQEDPATAVAVVVWAGLGALIALAANRLIIQPGFDRPRPFVALGFEPLAEHAVAPGFLSDHLVGLGAIAAGLWRHAKSWGLVAGLLAVLMAGARVYVGVHWPADVTVGGLFGALVGWLGWYAARYVLVPVTELLARGPTRFLVAGTGAYYTPSHSRTSD